MILTPSATAGPSTPRTPSTTFASTCAGSYYNEMPEGAIFPFPGPAPALHQRELYLHALEQEREEILAEAYAAKRSGSPLSTYSEKYTYNEYDSEDDEEGPQFDDRGRQLSFRETVRQRQARLEFLRRQDFARRIAHRGLEDAKASAYAIKRLPPPRARPVERVNAAIKIQRAWRLHHAVTGLQEVTDRVRLTHRKFLADSRKDYDAAWKTHAETLHELLRELGERTGVISAQSSTASSTPRTKTDNHALHPRVRAAARTAMEALRSELTLLDRAQISQHHITSPPSSPFLSGSLPSDSEDEDEFDYDDDSDSDDDDDDYASYTYTPPQSVVSTKLYVVDEEDEDELVNDLQQEHEPHITPSNAMGLYTSPPVSPTKTRPAGPRHQRTRHAPLSAPTPVKAMPTSVPGLIRSPVARSPSLASIPEEDDES